MISVFTSGFENSGLNRFEAALVQLDETAWPVCGTLSDNLDILSRWLRLGASFQQIVPGTGVFEIEVCSL